MSGAPIPVVLMRRNDGAIVVYEGGVKSVLAEDELATFVEKREQDHPRWVWDDTVHWYPNLLIAGVRVKHCADLRLRHNILRNSPLVNQAVLCADDIERWDSFAAEAPEDAVLFSFHAHTEALDVMGEFERQQAAVNAGEESKKLQLLLMAESTAALVATEMTFAGLPWRPDIHDQLLTEALGARPVGSARPPKLEQLCQQIRIALDSPNLNPDSPAELLRALQSAGLTLNDTRSNTLKQVAHPAIAPLLEYKTLQRLNAANGWRWLDEWVHNGRYRTTFIPGGVVTGRWAAIGGGALSLPSQVRPAVVADQGWTFVVADVAQLEPRVLAGMSQDKAMAQAAQGKDLYQGLVSAHVVETRDDAKLAMLGAMYGATQGKSAAMVARLAQRYPKAFGLVEAAAKTGERNDLVQTFLGRGSPVVDDNQARDWRAWGRFTRNFIVQGTGAEWAMCWMAVLRNLLWDIDAITELTDGPHLVFFLHDEIIVHTPRHLADEVAAVVRDSARKAGSLLFGNFPVDFPLDVSVVDVYADAK